MTNAPTVMPGQATETIPMPIASRSHHSRADDTDETMTVSPKDGLTKCSAGIAISRYGQHPSAPPCLPGPCLAANCNALGRNSAVESPRVLHATRQAAVRSSVRMRRTRCGTAERPVGPRKVEACVPTANPLPGRPVKGIGVLESSHPIDPESLAHDVLSELGTDKRCADRAFMDLLEDTKKVSNVRVEDVEDYDAIYLTGGHG